MNIRDVLENNYPYGGRMQVSNEGIFEKLKKAFTGKKSSDKETTAGLGGEKLYMWGLDLAYKQDPKSIELKTGELKVGSQNAAFFKRGDKDLTSPASEFDSDLKAYQRVISQSKPALAPQMRYIKEVYRTLEDADDYEPEDDDDVERFIDLVRGLIAKSPKSVVSTFREPSHSFLGFKTQPFTVKDKKGNLLFDYSDKSGTPATKVESATIEYPTQDEFVKLVGVLKALLAFTMDLEDEYVYSGWDGTDPPFRGFSEDVHAKLGSSIPFLYPDFDESNTEVVHIVVARCEALTRTLMWYLNVSVK